MNRSILTLLNQHISPTVVLLAIEQSWLSYTGWVSRGGMWVGWTGCMNEPIRSVYYTLNQWSFFPLICMFSMNIMILQTSNVVTKLAPLLPPCVIWQRKLHAHYTSMIMVSCSYIWQQRMIWRLTENNLIIDTCILRNLMCTDTSRSCHICLYEYLLKCISWWSQCIRFFTSSHQHENALIRLSLHCCVLKILDFIIF